MAASAPPPKPPSKPWVSGHTCLNDLIPIDNGEILCSKTMARFARYASYIWKQIAAVQATSPWVKALRALANALSKQQAL